MALSLGTAADAQIATRVYGAQWLIELNFSTGTQRLTTAAIDVTSGGHTWRSAPQIAVQSVNETEAIDGQRVVLAAVLADSDSLAVFLGDSSVYRARTMRLWLQVLSDAFVPVGSPVSRGVWRMEPIRILRQRADDGRNTSRIELPCSRSGLARARLAVGLRSTHQQQQIAYPGDLGLQYRQSLIEKPALWLSRRFQEV
jgi:hypothetical protein